MKELEKNLKETQDILIGSKKLKGKFPPISFLVDGIVKTLKIQNIFALRQEFKNFYLFKLKNYVKQPKIRHFLAVSLASQSSDLLVSLAKEFLGKIKELRLIQYSAYPHTLRINLFLIIELDNIQNYSDTVGVLKAIRLEFRKKLANF